MNLDDSVVLQTFTSRLEAEIVAGLLNTVRVLRLGC